MKNNKVLKWLYKIFIEYYGLIMVLLLALDLVSKAVMESILKSNGTITVIPNFFDFTLVYNTGAFAGMLGNTFGHILLIIISFAGSGIMIYGLIKFKNKFNKGMIIALVLAIPGCVGNLVDRVIIKNGTWRGVIDFFHFHIDAINFNWPVFNVADMLLVIGIIVFIIFYIIYDVKNEKIKKQALDQLNADKKKELENQKSNQDVPSEEDK